MNARLAESHKKQICSELGKVKLQLLYKASIHGFTGAAFHQRCDNRSPTVSVGYNTSGFVFGGYTKEPFSQSGQYVNDHQAFLFTFSGEKLLKYPVTGPGNAVRMMANCGPYFGEALVLVHESKPVVYGKPEKITKNYNPVIFNGRVHRVNDYDCNRCVSSYPERYYNFPDVQMHGNDRNLTECEVYQVEVSSVTQPRVLLVGPVGAGKSSFFNSVNSVFRGHVTSQAISGSSSTSLTTQFRSYSVKAGREGKPLPIILCDTMGLEDSNGAGLDIDDMSNILKGHLPDRYQVQHYISRRLKFNPSSPLHPEAHGYRTSPGLKDKIHCVVYVIDACKISIMPTGLEEKLNAIRRKVNVMGIPQLVLLTKVDEACPLVKEDLRNIYKSGYIKDQMQEVSSRLGVPLSCVVPVKNYSEELELDMNCDILLLSTIIQMLRFVDNYFDELSDRMSNMQTTEQEEVKKSLYKPD